MLRWAGDERLRSLPVASDPSNCDRLYHLEPLAGQPAEAAVKDRWKSGFLATNKGRRITIKGLIRRMTYWQAILADR